MNIQIINLIPLDYPYYVTRMKKQLPHVTLDYQSHECAEIMSADAYILIARELTDEVKCWVKDMRMNPSKLIYVLPHSIKEGVFWSVPKAFEKEFEIEKMMSFLGCIIEERPEVNLFQSLEIKIGKVQRDASLSVCAERLMKSTSMKHPDEVHFLIKEKTKRSFESLSFKNISVHPHWVRGVDTEMDYLIIKRKS